MNEINQLSLEDAIYIAGLFDGEGSINLSKISRLQEKGKTPTYSLAVRIRMTNEDIVRWLHSVIGGRFYIETERARKLRCLNGKLSYSWVLAGQEGVYFLRQIYPYLKVKKLQAEIAFKYEKTFFIRKGQLKLPDNLVQEKELLRSEMLLLNKRGLN